MNEIVSSIVIAIVVVGIISLVCAFILILGNKFFSVPVDEKFTKLRECLPGANCGACGFSGCDGYAQALAENPETKTNLCVPGGADAAEALSQIMGVSCESVEAKVAYNHCQGGCGNTEKKYEYEGIETCKAAKMLYGGDGSCTFGCLGYGDCAAACPSNAICIEQINDAENGYKIAHVDPRICTGCGVCVKTCPNHVLGLVPKEAKTAVTCNNKNMGVVARKACTNACIACHKCEKNCPQQAITIVENLAQIDYSLCNGCGTCVQECPVHALKEVQFQ